MTTPNLARLESVELGTVWPSESEHFTPWLADPANIAIVGDVLGLELVVDATEVGIGPYRADIVCRDASNGDSDGPLVLIENQLARTDHSHLGQLMTYAAGLDAVTVVWIAAPFTDEHRVALDWLNQKTDQSVRFFGLELEVWKIGNSEMAPWLHAVVKPAEFRADPGLGETQRLQLAFWTDYQGYVREQRPDIGCGTPAPQSWMNHTIGKNGFHFASVINRWRPPSVRVELYLSGEYADARFRLLEHDKQAIEADFGEPLNWRNPPEQKSAQIQHVAEIDFSDTAQRDDAMAWLLDTLAKFRTVFVHRVMQLDASDADVLTDDAR